MNFDGKTYRTLLYAKKAAIKFSTDDNLIFCGVYEFNIRTWDDDPPIIYEKFLGEIVGRTRLSVTPCIENKVVKFTARLKENGCKITAWGSLYFTDFTYEYKANKSKHHISSQKIDRRIYIRRRHVSRLRCFSPERRVRERRANKIMTNFKLVTRATFRIIPEDRGFFHLTSR